MSHVAPKGRLSVVVKEKIKSNPSTESLRPVFEQRFIEVYDFLPGDQRLMLMSSASISSAVVMIFEEAE